jgi:hypothetical protein
MTYFNGFPYESRDGLIFGNPIVYEMEDGVIRLPSFHFALLVGFDWNKGVKNRD